MSWVQTLAVVFHVLLAASIIGLVLIQRGKGADAGACFGAGASGTVFGARGSGSFLSRATGILATLFFLTSLGLSYLFSQQQADGSWPLAEEAALTDGNGELPADERYSMIPLQTAFPLRGLAACGYATDPRAERAYEWLLAQRLDDGAWPTGIAAGVYGFVAGYRKLIGSRWGCRSNTTGALLCLALHSERRTSEPARRALDLLLGQERRELASLGQEAARLVGAEPAHGFFTYFARFDLALVVELCGRVGLSKDEPRLADLLEFIHSLQGEYGLWEAPSWPQATRWLTFDLLRSLGRFFLTENRESL